MKPANVTSVLLVGPKGAQKSSFLMQGAVHYAEQGHTVIYITSNELSSLPVPLQGLPRPTPDVFSLIKFIYLPCWQDLLQHIFSLHIHTLIPTVLIVEALEHYCTVPDHIHDSSHNASQASHAALICASLFDGAAVCARRTKSGVQLIVSLNQQLLETRFSPLINIFFTDVVWTFEKTKSDDPENSQEAYAMTNVECSSSQVKHYKIFFEPQSKNGSVVVNKVTFWDNVLPVPP